MDTDLWVRMLSTGARYGHLNAWVAGFRWHTRSKTRGEGERSRAEYELAANTRWRSIFPTRGWRRLSSPAFRLLQCINGNYLQMIFETSMHRGKPWTVLAEQ
jgi:hypothetical protein